jgi:hypothetical protein
MNIKQLPAQYRQDVQTVAADFRVEDVVKGVLSYKF